MQWPGPVSRRGDLSQDLKEAVRSFQLPYERQRTTIFIVHASKVRLRGARFLARSHTAPRGRAGSSPHRLELGSSLVSPRPSGALGLGAPWAVSPLPSSGAAVAAAKEGAEDPSGFLLGLLVLPRPSPVI